MPFSVRGPLACPIQAGQRRTHFVMGSHNHDYTLRIAEMALERIKALSLPADPPGYELWYSYSTGRNPEMNRRINSAINENGSLSVFELDGIYEEYLASARRDADIE